jgi:hypothetical protein
MFLRISELTVIISQYNIKIVSFNRDEVCLLRGRLTFK